MSYLHERIKKLCEALDQRAYQDGEPIALEYCLCGYKTENRPPENAVWKPLPDDLDLVYDGDDRSEKNHGWLRGRFTKSSREGCSSIIRNMTYGANDFRVNPQFSVYIDGRLTTALDAGHRFVYTDGLADGEHEILIYFYINKTFLRRIRFETAYEDDDVEGLYYDVRVPLDALMAMEDGTREYGLLLRELSDALSLVDFRRDAPDFREGVKKARKRLDRYFKSNGNGDRYCFAIGHTHIDVAWLWTFAQTREKVQRSFSTVVHLMERYPEYKFMSSQAQLYEFLKQDAPEVYEKIKKLVKEGRWEVEGAMWVEADCNLPSGESLVRQILYGKRFFKEEFGADCRVLWLPDVFGYSAALPQILKKSGVEYFVTSKIGWNETNRLPYDVFSWRGIDGSCVFTWFLTTQDKIRGRAPKTDSTYNGSMNAQQIMGAWDRFQQKDICDTVITTYGYGDGGGGPNAHMIETAKRLERGVPECPKVEFGFAGGFLDKVRRETEESGRLPEWNGELYLEYHRGTYTSQARNKRNNRRAEFLLQNMEKAALIRRFVSGADSFDRGLMKRSWKTVLLCQFHDVIPGSSIEDVYRDTDAMYKKLFSECEERYSDDISAIASRVPGAAGEAVVFNPNSFGTGAELKMPDGRYAYFADIPPMGYAVLRPEKDGLVAVDCENATVENAYIKITFDGKRNLASVYDKRARREVLKGSGNVLTAFEDYPRAYDAWEISEYYTEKSYPVDGVVAFDPFFEGDRAGFVVERRFNKSVIRQEIALYGHTSRIDFETELDWHEDHILLKAAFPIDVLANEATYDIQFGSVKRPTHKNTSWDSARFECAAHKFADVSEYGYGAAVLNDCKYGYSVDGGTISLSLLKCATSPDKNADQGRHIFTYSLFPHSGDLFSSGTVSEAYLLNNPPVVAGSGTDGISSAPRRYSAVEISEPDIICDTLKPSEDGKGIIARFYECFGKRTDAKISFGFNVKEAHIADLNENEKETVDVRNDVCDLSFGPFEIITLKITEQER